MEVQVAFESRYELVPARLGLDDIDFVGIQEHFAEDVADLGRMLGWPAVEIPVRARTTTPEYLAFHPGEELLERIRAANEADVEFYEQALERRRAGRASAGVSRGRREGRPPLRPPAHRERR